MLRINRDNNNNHTANGNANENAYPHTGVIPPNVNAQETGLSNATLMCRAFIQAVLTVDLIKIKKMILSGFDPNISVVNGDTALMIAIKYASLELLSCLLHFVTPQTRIDCNQFTVKVDVNLKNNQELTALIMAIQLGRLDMVLALLGNGANANIPAKGRITPLMLAARLNREDIVRQLLYYSADPHSLSPTGKNALFFAIECKSTKALLQTIHNKMRMPWIDSLGNTLQHAAACFDYPDAIELFKNDKPFLEARNKQKATPLIIASYHGMVNALKKLIELGADVNAKDIHGNTPLMYAVDKESIDCVRLLIAAGADQRCANNSNQTISKMLAGSMNHQLKACFNQNDVQLVHYTPIHFPSNCVVAPAGFERYTLTECIALPELFNSNDVRQSKFVYLVSYDRFRLKQNANVNLDLNEESEPLPSTSNQPSDEDNMAAFEEAGRYVDEMMKLS